MHNWKEDMGSNPTSGTKTKNMRNCLGCILSIIIFVIALILGLIFGGTILLFGLIVASIFTVWIIIRWLLKI